jgi:hypothetical protein
VSGFFSHLAQRVRNPDSTPRPAAGAHPVEARERPLEVVTETQETVAAPAGRGTESNAPAPDAGRSRTSLNRSAVSAGTVAMTADISNADVVAPANVSREHVAFERTVVREVSLIEATPTSVSRGDVPEQPLRHEARAARPAGESDRVVARDRERLPFAQRPHATPTQDSRAETPTVHVSIGRIEIRSPRPERNERASAPAPAPARISLDDYLQGASRRRP